ncbi:hypothetical protein ACJ41O_008826 [Fusarium nematophilum]
MKAPSIPSNQQLAYSGSPTIVRDLLRAPGDEYAGVSHSVQAFYEHYKSKFGREASDGRRTFDGWMLSETAQFAVGMVHEVALTEVELDRLVNFFVGIKNAAATDINDKVSYYSVNGRIAEEDLGGQTVAEAIVVWFRMSTFAAKIFQAGLADKEGPCWAFQACEFGFSKANKRYKGLDNIGRQAQLVSIANYILIAGDAMARAAKAKPTHWWVEISPMTPAKWRFTAKKLKEVADTVDEDVGFDLKNKAQNAHERMVELWPQAFEPSRKKGKSKGKPKGKSKGKAPVRDSYRWILENREFVQWRRDLSGRLLWIRGDPGKGKTMLLCGIIDELTRKSDSGPLAFFFCQETESRLNSATAVLRGLIYMLVKQREPLMKHLLQRYKDAKKHLFEDSNACVALGRILTAMLEDPSSKGTVLVIDALDECVTDLPQLLELIVELSDSAVKLVVSSRNWLEVEELEAAPQKVALRLELNARAISDAVDIFIEHRVQKLPQFSAGDDNLKDTVLRHLSANANGTFLWVAIVCKAVHDHRLSKYQVVDKVKEFPQGFMPLYQRMMEYILSSPNAQLCRQILATVAIVYRTVTLQELVYLVPELRPFEEDPDEIKRMVKECGSFLNVRQDVVYFVHQSAKDFLLSSSDFMPASSVGRHHYALFTTALDVLHETLERDIYNLGSPGFLLKDIDPPKPDPLGSIVYCYVNWVRHLQDSGLARDHAIFEEGGVIERFLRAQEWDITSARAEDES